MKARVVVLFSFLSIATAEAQHRHLRRALLNFIVGNESDNAIKGTGLDDVINGRAGNDVVQGDNGADILYGSGGSDNLTGGSKGDRLFGGLGRDTLRGGVGYDQLSGGEKDDLLFAGGGSVKPNPSSALAGDILYGGPGADRMVLGPGPDLVFIGRTAEEDAAAGRFDRIQGFHFNSSDPDSAAGDIIFVAEPAAAVRNSNDNGNGKDNGNGNGAGAGKSREPGKAGKRKHVLDGDGNRLYLDGVRIAVVEGQVVNDLILNGRIEFSDPSSSVTDIADNTAETAAANAASDEGGLL